VVAPRPKRVLRSLFPQQGRDCLGCFGFRHVLVASGNGAEGERQADQGRPNPDDAAHRIGATGWEPMRAIAMPRRPPRTGRDCRVRCRAGLPAVFPPEPGSTSSSSANPKMKIFSSRQDTDMVSQFPMCRIGPAGKTSSCATERKISSYSSGWASVRYDFLW
jgi:hypothetical protein